jgi:excisionase family DNA binding protein
MRSRRQTDTLTVPEAGQRLGIGRRQAYDAARRGEIPVIRIGRRVLVPKPAFERLLLDGQLVSNCVN